MTPLTQNPELVVLLGSDNRTVIKVATNIAPDVKVILVWTEEAFAELATNKPFVVLS